MDRRAFVKLVLGIPVLGAVVLFVSPLFRYLKPTAGVFPGGLISEPDAPHRIKDISFPLSDFPKPWTVQEFVFAQSNPEYTRQGVQISKVPGYALRIPGKSADDYNFVVYSRICPHMGCIFRYVPDPAEAEQGFHYRPPNGTPVFACPCHLSVYDPLQTQIVNGKAMNGKVVSGPAPRPPRHFEFSIANGTLSITNLERGGIS
jgi:Rieske Fe-S protein